MHKSKASDKNIYSRLRKKDKQAFMQAYDRYADDIYRFVYFKVSSAEEAEDITSQVFLKTWDYIQNNDLKDRKGLKALFYTTARHTVIDHYRQHSRAGSTSLDDAPEIADERQDPAKQLADQDDYQALLENIKQLKDEYREVLILKYVNELSVGEIAEAIGKKKGNVRVIVYRATQALKELAGEKDS